MVGTSNQSVPEMTIEDIPMVAEGFSMTSDVLWRKETWILFGHGRFVSGPAWRSLSMLLQVIPVHRAPVGRRSLQDEDQRVLLRSWWNDMHWQKTLKNGMKWTSTGLWCEITHTHIYIYVYIYVCNSLSAYVHIIEGSLEVKLPAVWTDGKAEVGRVREEKRREEKKKEDQRRERVRRKKMQVHEKVETSRITVFSNLCLRRVEK